MVPLIGIAQTGATGYFDDAGFPAGSGWEEIAFPETTDAHCYALEIAGNSMLPVYRDGDRILVSLQGSLRRSDRLVVKTNSSEVLAKQLGRMTAQRIELNSLNPAFEDRNFGLKEIAFVHASSGRANKDFRMWAGSERIAIPPQPLHRFS